MTEWRYDIDNAGGGDEAPFFLITAEGPEDGVTVKQVGEAWRHDGLIYWANQGTGWSNGGKVETEGWEVIAWMPMPAPASRPIGAAPSNRGVVLTRLELTYLRQIVRGPVPCSSVNKRVSKSLTDKKLVTVAQRPSPFPSNIGRMIDHLVATDAGRARAAEGASS